MHTDNQANTPMAQLNLPMIGIHHTPLVQKFGTPRQPNLVAIDSVIEFYPPFDTPKAFLGIEQYSHLWVLWHFHHNKMPNNKMQDRANFRPQVRPPRLGGNDKLGVFATRSMYRPSPIGLSVVELVDVVHRNNSVHLCIRGADMIDGTPIVDIKPYLPYSDSITDATAKAFDKPIQRAVMLSDNAINQAAALGMSDKLAVIQSLISYDPRPAYRQDDPSLFVMRYDKFDVSFCLGADGFEIVGLQMVGGR